MHPAICREIEHEIAPKSFSHSNDKPCYLVQFQNPKRSLPGALGQPVQKLAVSPISNPAGGAPGERGFPPIVGNIRKGFLLTSLMEMYQSTPECRYKTEQWMECL